MIYARETRLTCTLPHRAGPGQPQSNSLTVEQSNSLTAGCDAHANEIRQTRRRYTRHEADTKRIRRDHTAHSHGLHQHHDVQKAELRYVYNICNIRNTPCQYTEYTGIYYSILYHPTIYCGTAICQRCPQCATHTAAALWRQRRGDGGSVPLCMSPSPAPCPWRGPCGHFPMREHPAPHRDRARERARPRGHAGHPARNCREIGAGRRGTAVQGRPVARATRATRAGTAASGL